MPLSDRAALNRLRASSRQDYLHALLIAPDIREDFVAMRRFHRELLRIVREANDAAIAEIRMQWWADGLRELRAAELASHPIGAELLELVRRRPEARDPLAAKAEAFALELYPDAPPDRSEFEGRAGETRAIPLQLLVAERGKASTLSDASGHFGVVEAVSETLEELPRRRTKGRVPVPADILSEAGVSAESFLNDEDAAKAATRLFARFGMEHAQKVRAALRGRQVGRAFASLALYEYRMSAAAGNPIGAVNGRLGPGPLRTQWLLWRG